MGDQPGTALERPACRVFSRVMCDPSPCREDAVADFSQFGPGMFFTPARPERKRGTQVFPLIRRNLIILLLCIGMAGVMRMPPAASAQEGQNTWERPEWVMTPAEANAYRRSSEFRAALEVKKATSPGAQQERILRRVVQYWLSQLTFEDRSRLPKEVVERLLTTEIMSSLTVPRPRQMMMDEVIDKAPDLLKHPDPIVRTNTMLLLNQLSVEPPTFRGGTHIPAVPYVPTFRLLSEVLTDSDQIDEVRIHAARGLGRIARDAGTDLGGNQRSEIAETLVEALNQTPVTGDDHILWLRYRITESLGYVDRLDNTIRAPIVIDTLLQVIGNPEESWLVRSQAARSVSQLPFEQSTNLPLVTHEIVSLLLEMATAYSEANQKRDEWRHSFFRVYLAFQPARETEALQRRWGLLYQLNRPGLGGERAYVRQAFETAFSVVQPCIQRPPQEIPPDALEALQEWVTENIPENRQATPNSQPLAVARVADPENE